jgi:hypothetical protein
MYKLFQKWKRDVMIIVNSTKGHGNKDVNCVGLRRQRDGRVVGLDRQGLDEIRTSKMVIFRSR